MTAWWALGECGLDYHYDFCPKLLQKGVFLNQLEIARRIDMPVILHVARGPRPMRCTS